MFGCMREGRTAGLIDPDFHALATIRALERDTFLRLGRHVKSGDALFQRRQVLCDDAFFKRLSYALSKICSTMSLDQILGTRLVQGARLPSLDRREKSFASLVSLSSLRSTTDSLLQDGSVRSHCISTLRSACAPYTVGTYSLQNYSNEELIPWNWEDLSQ